MPRKLPIPSLMILLSAMSILSGCGGGGGGGGGSTPTPSAITLTGTIHDGNGIALSGDKVSDPIAATSTTSAQDGTFALEVPASASGNTAVIDFYNSSNQLVSVESFSITAASGGTQNIGTITLGPPAPPSSPGAAIK